MVGQARRDGLDGARQQRLDCTRNSTTKPTGNTPRPWVISLGEGLLAELVLDELRDVERASESMHLREVRISDHVRAAAPSLLTV